MTVAYDPHSEWEQEQSDEEQYRDLLDEIYPPIRFGDLSYDPSRVLESVDPTAYRLGLAEFVDDLDAEREADGSE